MKDRPIAELPLDRIPGRMLTAAAGRRLAHEAQRHLQAGMPQLAVLAFDHVGRAVAQWGRYEREELDLLMQAISPLLASGSVCLDIGANIGNHAVFFAGHFAEVLAFEPNPRTFALLQFNAGLAHNVRCFNVGLSDQAGSAQLSVPAGNIGMATLHGAANGAGDTAVACRLERLDDLAELQSRRVGLVKIDVEGHETAVLRGAGALLRRDRPLVVFEQAAAEIRDGTSSALELLRQAGYGRVWVLEAQPAGGPRWSKLLRRLLFGEKLQLVQTDRLAARFHSMVVALP